MGDSYDLGAASHKALSRILCHHGRGAKPCPLCEGVPDVSLLDHMLSAHGRELNILFEQVGGVRESVCSWISNLCTVFGHCMFESIIFMFSNNSCGHPPYIILLCS